MLDNSKKKGRKTMNIFQSSMTSFKDLTFPWLQVKAPDLSLKSFPSLSAILLDGMI